MFQKCVLSLAVVLAITAVAGASPITVSLDASADNRPIGCPGYTPDYCTENDGAGIFVYVYRDSTNAETTLMKFDLSSIPSGQTIISASLALKVTENNSSGYAVNVYRLTQPWTEMGSTWNTYDGTNAWPGGGGGMGDAVGSNGVTAASGGTPYATNPGTAAVGTSATWDLTSLVSTWYSGSAANDGLLLSGVTGAGPAGWARIRFTTPGRAASLRAYQSHTSRPEPGTLALLAAGLTGLLAYAWRKRK